MNSENDKEIHVCIICNKNIEGMKLFLNHINEKHASKIIEIFDKNSYYNRRENSYMGIISKNKLYEPSNKYNNKSNKNYIESNKNYIESNKYNIESNKYNIESNKYFENNKGNIESIKNNSERNKNYIESNKFNFEKNKYNNKSNKNYIESNKYNIESNKYNIESNKYNIESNKYFENNKSNIESNKKFENNKNNFESSKNNIERNIENNNNNSENNTNNFEMNNVNSINTKSIIKENIINDIKSGTIINIFESSKDDKITHCNKEKLNCVCCKGKICEEGNCYCPKCMKLNIKKQNLINGELINKSGNIAQKKIINNKIVYFCGKKFFKDIDTYEGKRTFEIPCKADLRCNDCENLIKNRKIYEDF